MLKEIKHNLYQEIPYKPSIILLFSKIGMLICTSMAFLALFTKSFFLSAMLFVATFIYYLGFYVCKKHQNIQLSSAIVLYSLYLLMFFLVFTGGVANTGPLWIYIVAPVSLSIHGFRRGLIDIAVFTTLIILIMFIPSNIAYHATYPIEFKLRLIYSFLTVSFLTTLYEYTRDHALKKTLELKHKYQKLANFDPLTNLSNRRVAYDILKQEQSHLSRNKEKLSILICDVDEFKRVNDQYGHNAGDAVLIELAKLFNEQIREQDCVARWGGEEFLFILPQTSAKNAAIIAEKIRSKVENHVINYQEHNIQITISMGIAQFEMDAGIDEVINHADKCLYKAKDLGRNRIQASNEN